MKEINLFSQIWIIPIILTVIIILLVFFVAVPALEYLQEHGLRVLWYGTGGD